MVVTRLEGGERLPGGGDGIHPELRTALQVDFTDLKEAGFVIHVEDTEQGFVHRNRVMEPCR